MKDLKKTKAQLIRELNEMSRLASELEAAESACRQIEAELRRNEENHKILLDNIPDVLYSLDDTGHISNVSPTARLSGFKETDILGKHFLRLIHPDDREKVRESFQSAIRDRREVTRGLRFRFLTKDRSVRFGEINFHTLFDQDGRYVRNDGVLRDITDLVHEEEALKKAAADISDLYDNAPCGYHSLDRNGLFLRMNKTELNWLGYGEEEIIGKKRFTDLLTPESVKVFRKNYPLFMKRGRIADLDFDMIRKGGSILTVLLSATALYDEKGRYLMSRSTLFDNTERRLSEKKLLESQQRMELALKGGALGSWDVDLTTGHTTVNERWAEILGYTYDELKDPREIWLHTIHPDDLDRVLKLGRDFRKGKIHKYEAEYRGITKQGMVVWLVSKAVNVGRGPDGMALRMVGTFQDITERKLSEEKRVALNRELDDANKQLQLAYAWMRDSRDQLRDHLFKEGIGFLVDREGGICGMAERVLETTGMQRQKILGSPILDLFSDGCRAAFKVELGRAWKGISHPIKLEMRTAGGEFALFQTNITRFTMRNKRLLLIILN